MSCRRSVLAALRKFPSLGLGQMVGLVRARSPWIRRGTISGVLDALEGEGKIVVDRAPGLAAYSLKKKEKDPCPRS